MMPFPYPVNRVYSVRTSILMHGRRFTPIRTRKLGSWHALRHFRVQVSEDGNMTASQIRDFLADYTRYTNPFAYSNNLAYRLDYYKATEATRISAGKTGPPQRIPSGADGNEAMVELRALESTRVSAPGCSTEGTVYSCISAFGDYNDDGVLDPRESLVYVPDSAKMPVPTALPS